MQQAVQRTWGGKERNPGVGSAMPVDDEMQTASALLCILYGCGLLQAEMHGAGRAASNFFVSGTTVTRPVPS